MFSYIVHFIDTHRQRLLFIPWMAVFSIITGSLLPSSAVEPVFVASDKLVHGGCYGVTLMLFCLFYYYKIYRIIALYLAALGVCIEFLQGLLPTRSFDPMDILANCSGLLISWCIMRYWYHPKADKALAV